MLYLDGDIIVTADIAALYDSDLRGLPLGAACDADKTRDIELLKNGPRSGIIKKNPLFASYDSLYHYFTAYVGLSDAELRSYINGGVMLLDIARAGAVLEEGLPQVLSRPYCYQDQDIFNVLFKGRTCIFDAQCNTLIPQVEACLQQHGRLPLIMHFAGGSKPDLRLQGAPYELYWRHLAQTPFFSAALDRYVKAQVQHLARQAGHDIADLKKRVAQLERRRDGMDYGGSELLPY